MEIEDARILGAVPIDGPLGRLPYQIEKAGIRAEPIAGELPASNPIRRVVEDVNRPPTTEPQRATIPMENANTWSWKEIQVTPGLLDVTLRSRSTRARDELPGNEGADSQVDLGDDTSEPLHETVKELLEHGAPPLKDL